MSTLDFLFPAPALPPSILAPSHSPGISTESTRVLREVLKDNHERWHIFFNPKRFHNHAPHRAIALWALGADASTIKDKYDKDCEYEKPAKKSPNSITLENFQEHLGDDTYFSAYSLFFTEHIQTHGVAATLDCFLFSPQFNTGSHIRGESQVENPPQMLNRFLAGVLHPIIHTGYGAEFGLPGMLVEGLAEAAVHRPSADLLGPLRLFSEPALPVYKDAPSHAVQGITSIFSQTVQKFDTIFGRVYPKSTHVTIQHGDPQEVQSSHGILEQPRGSEIPKHAQSSETPIPDRRAVDIFVQLSHDPRLQIPSSGDENDTYNWTIRRNAHFVAEAMGDWGWSVMRKEEEGLSGRVETEVDRKIEEVVWLVCALYGIGGWTNKRPDGTLNADFFFMHLVTSSLFLPSLAVMVSPVSRARLLRGYLATTLMWYIARGKPKLDIPGFFAAPLEPLPSPALSDPANNGRPCDQSNNHDNINWYAVLQSAAQHADEHLTKAQRSLANWAGLLGGKTVVMVVPSGKAEQMGLIASARPSLETSNKAGEAGAQTQTSGNDDERLGDGGDGTGCADDVLGQHPSAHKVDDGGPESQLSPVSPIDPGEKDEGPTQVVNQEITAASDSSKQNQESKHHPQDAQVIELDGSLFLRTALLTARRMGWIGFPDQKEGDFWDFQGFWGNAQDDLRGEERRKERHEAGKPENAQDDDTEVTGENSQPRL